MLYRTGAIQIHLGDPGSSLSFKLKALASVILLYLPSFDSFKENEVGKIRGDIRAEVCTPRFKCSRTSSLHKL